MPVPVQLSEDEVKQEWSARLPRVIMGQLYRDIMKVFADGQALKQAPIGFSEVRLVVMQTPCGRWIDKQIIEKNVPVNFSNRVVWEAIKNMKTLGWIENSTHLSWALTEKGWDARNEIIEGFNDIKKTLFAGVVDGQEI